MKVGNKTIAFNFYGNVNSRLKLIPDITDVQLPSIETASDAIKGAGILGEIDWPSFGQIGSMTLGINFRVASPDIVAISTPQLQEIEVRWVMDKFDTNNIKIGVEAHKVFVKGMPKKHDQGKIENAAAMDGSNEFEVVYYRHIIDGVETLLIDKFNYVYKINGVDYTSEIKAAL